VTPPLARTARFWPYLLFIGSGAAALIEEAVFLRQMGWLFGNSAKAASLVLAAFMAGLALGALVFGRLADRVARPLRLFAALECGTAVAAAGLIWLLGAGREAFLAPMRAIEPGALRWLLEPALAFALILVPATLMGGTLPALSRHAIRELDRFLVSLGLLYGANTLGAACGVFVAGFYLFELLGIARSGLLAALVQVAVAGAAFILDRTTAGRASEGRGIEADVALGPPGGRAAERLVCIAAASVCGFVVLGYEVIWTRLLSLPMRSFSYSFSLMLSLFLLGLCIGAAALGLARRILRRPASWLGGLLVLMGAWVAGSLFWLPQRLAPVGGASFEEFLARSAANAALVVLPPTVLSGMALPLAARGFASARGRIGREVGLVYGANTAGAIAGALAAGLLLLPGLGASATLGWLALVNTGAGLAVLLARREKPLVLAAAALATLGAAGSLAAASEGRFVDAFLRASGGGESIGALLYFHEGATDTVAIVTKDYGFRDPEAKSLITNGVAMSATVKPVWRYMALEGHLPLLLAESPRRALAIGVGTGITLAALVSHPELESVAAVELSEGVAGGLPRFERENARAYADPRVRLVREDGRHWLELTRERFDAITLEPPPPIVAGSVHLYSYEFYELCRRRLEPGGVVAQWLPLHAQSLASARMTARTFLDAFPHALLFLPSVRDAVLVGSAEPLDLDAERVLAAFASPSVRADLERAYVETPEALLATWLLDREGIARFAADAPRITDDRPWMEFFRRQGGNMGDRDLAAVLGPPQASLDGVRGLAARGELLERVRRGNDALRLHVRAAAERDAQLAVEAARISAGTEFFLYGLGCARAQLERLAALSTDDAAAQARRCAELQAAPS
jgi:spermidine synthase